MKIEVNLIITDIDGSPMNEEVKILDSNARHPNDFKIDHPDFTYFQFSSSHSKDEYNDDWYVERNCHYDGYLIKGKKVCDAVVTFEPIIDA